MISMDVDKIIEDEISKIKEEKSENTGVTSSSKQSNTSNNVSA
ncbi:hypothetical protein HBNXNv_0359 [Candidatus Nanohalovita haloferacivicina]|nr:hypothetical protein HBNXNv_0359 [Candidatus Nanohalobia archaeon BNXNv]